MTIETLLAAVDQCKDKRIIVIGDLMIDMYSWGTIDRLNPEEVGSPLIKVNDDTYRLGGAANVAHNLATLGAQVYLYGVINEQDHSGSILITECQEKNISLHHINSKRPTTTKQRIMSRNRQIARIDREETSQITPEQGDDLLKQLKADIPFSNVILFSDYHKGLLIPNLCQEVITIASIYDIPVLADPKPENITSFANTYLISPNQKETEKIIAHKIHSNPSITSQNNIEYITTVGPKLCEVAKCQIGVITLGEEGVGVYDSTKNRSYHIPTFAKEVEDVTGAGDTFIATLTIGIAAHLNLNDAVKLANIAAGYAVSKVGTYAVTKEDIQRHANRLNFDELYQWK